MSRNTETGDYAHDLAMLAHERRAVEQRIGNKVHAARKHGQTWADIAACLGVTKQAAQQRYGRPPAP